jgi:hypothetical protein
MAADGTLHQALGVATLETGALGGSDKAVYLDAGFSGPIDQVSIDLLSQHLSAGAGDQGQFGFLTVRTKKFCGRNGVGRHLYIPPFCLLSLGQNAIVIQYNQLYHFLKIFLLFSAKFYT